MMTIFWVESRREFEKKKAFAPQLKTKPKQVLKRDKGWDEAQEVGRLLSFKILKERRPKHTRNFFFYGGVSLLACLAGGILVDVRGPKDGDVHPHGGPARTVVIAAVVGQTTRAKVSCRHQTGLHRDKENPLP